jgi:Insertion element 4 transposase N-terminal/Transposase DDE domain
VDAEGVRERKKRSLPSVLIVYLNLALWLFPDQGMGQCLRELAAGLPQLAREPARWRNAASTSISKARERVGPGVMRQIFCHLAGPLGGQKDLWRGRRVCAVDGTTVKVPDSEENAACFGGPMSSPFPLLRLLVLAECATKSIIDAAACAYATGERTAVYRLLGSLRPGMLVLFDRGFCSHPFFRDAAATGADLVFRVSASFKLTPLPGPAAVLDDGTYLAELKPRIKRDGPPITVRVIEYSVTTRALGKGKTTSEVFCLVTNLTDPDTAPALELAALYARRWKIEVLYKAVKVDLSGARPVLRSGHADTVMAEIWSLLALFQILLRLADAAITTHLDDGGDPIDLEQISIKNARGALRRTIGQATTQLTEMTQAMTAFTEDLLSTLTPRRPAGPPPVNAKPAAATRSRPSLSPTASSRTRWPHEQPNHEPPEQQEQDHERLNSYHWPQNRHWAFLIESRTPRSGRVRCQGLEPRTRGLRVRCSGVRSVLSLSVYAGSSATSPIPVPGRAAS